MRRGSFPNVIVAISGWLLLVAAPTAAQSPPDLQGFWGEADGGGNGTNIETGFQTADTLRVQGWTDAQLAARKPVSAIVDPADGKIPYQPWAAARREEILARHGGDNNTRPPETPRDEKPDHFRLPGMRRAAYRPDCQIVQPPGV